MYDTSRDSLKKALLAGAACFVVSALTAEARAQTNLDGSTITSGDTNGLVDSGAGDTTTLDPGNGALTFGADGGSNAVDHDDSSGAGTETITIGDNGGADSNNVIFAEDAAASANNATLNINIGEDSADNNAELVVQGDLSENSATETVEVTVGDTNSNSNNNDAQLTINSANNENLTIDAEIIGTNEDTSTVLVSDNDGADNTITFTDEIGTQNSEIDRVVIDSTGTNNTEAVFENTLETRAVTQLGSTETDNGTNTARFDATPNSGFSVKGGIAGTADETDNIRVAPSGASSVITFEGQIGPNDNIDNIIINNTNSNNNASATFEDAVDASNGLQLGESGTGSGDNTATFDASNQAFTVSADITGTSNENLNDVVVAGSGSNTVTFTGDVGGNDNITNVTVGSSAAADAEFQGNVTAGTIAVDASSGAADATFSDSVDADTALNVTAGGSNDANATLEAGVSTNTVNVTGGVGQTAKADFKGDLDATIGGGTGVTLDETAGTAEIEFSGGTQSVSGTIVGNAGGEGSVIVSGSDVTFNNEIGGTTNIGTFNVENGGSATISNNIEADGGDVAVKDGGTLSVTGGSGVTLESTGSGSVDIDGRLESNLGGNSLTLNSGGANTKIGHSNGAVIKAGNQISGNSNVDITDDATIAINKTGSFNPAGGPTVFDLTGQTIDVDNSNNGALTVKLADSSDSFADGDKITVIDSAGTAAGNFGGKIGSAVSLQSGPVIRLVDDGSSGGTLSVEVVIDTSGLPGETGKAAGTIVNAGTSGGTAIDDVRQILNSPDSVDQASRVTDAARGQTGASVASAASAGARAGLKASSTRLAALRGGYYGGGRGIATGNGQATSSIWGKTFGHTGEQDTRGGEPGYDTQGWGVAFGVDNYITPNNLLGFAVSYSQGNVDGDDVAGSEVDVDSWQVMAYGEHRFGGGAFLDGQLAYSMHSFDQSRTVPGVDTISSDYDGDQLTAKASLGRDYKGYEITMTPAIDALYSRQGHDEHTEIDSDGDNFQQVDPDPPDSLELGASVQAISNFRYLSGAVFQPALNAAYRYDVLDEVYGADKSVSGGNTRPEEGLDPSNHTLVLGGGFDYKTSGYWTFTADYDYEFREDFASHNGMLRVRMDF